MATPELDRDPIEFKKTDGSLYTRVEMEAQLREKRKKAYSLRLLATSDFGLENKVSFDMTVAVLRHWVLDEMIRRGLITGDIVGVNVQSYNDEHENRQFIQRLTALVQMGQALVPKEGEGVDMSNIPQPPGPPAGPPPNGQPQQGFVPPPPPMGIGGPPQQAYPQQQQFVPPAPAPQQPFAPAPQAPPQQFVPQGPPQQQFVPPAGPPMPPQAPQMAPGQPMMPPGYAPPPGVPQGVQGMPPGPPMAPQGPPPGPPQAPPQQAAQGGGRRRGGQKQDAAPQAAPPPAAPVPPVGGQQGFAPPPPAQGFQQAPLPTQGGFPLPGFAPQAQAPMPMQQAPQQVAQLSDTAALQGQIAELKGLVQQQGTVIASLMRQVQLSNIALTILSRAVYQKQGSADIEGWLKELGVQLPQ